MKKLILMLSLTCAIATTAIAQGSAYNPFTGSIDTEPTITVACVPFTVRYVFDFSTAPDYNVSNGAIVHEICLSDELVFDSTRQIIAGAHPTTGQTGNWGIGLFDIPFNSEGADAVSGNCITITQTGNLPNGSNIFNPNNFIAFEVPVMPVADGGAWDINVDMQLPGFFGGDGSGNANDVSDDDEEITVNSACILPVELVSFDASKVGETSNLEWVTAIETNSSHFEVQRSVDGERFENIGLLNAAGSSVKSLDYAFVDQQPFTGINYYRLKMVDVDGSFSHSNVETVRFVSEQSVSFFPNPAKDYVRYSMDNINSKDDVEVEIFDTRGMRVLRKTISEEGQKMSLEGTIDLRNLPAGVYHIRTVSSDDLLTKTIEVIR